MMMIKRTVLLPLATCLLLPACAGAHRGAPWDGAVRVDGGFHAMLQEGKTGPAVELGSLLPDPTLYALGALAELEGEVTIVGGKAYLSYGEEGSARVQSPESPNAGGPAASFRPASPARAQS